MSWLLLAALAVRAAAVVAGSGNLADDPDDYRAMARDFLAHGRLEIGGHPTAFRPPLYPLVLAAWGAALGLSDASIAALHVLLGVATVALVVTVGRLWQYDRAAYLAGILVACDPILVHQSTVVMTETLATLAAVIALLALTCVSRRGTARSALAAGLALALCVLCRPVFLLWGIISALALMLVRDKRQVVTESNSQAQGWKLSAACALGLVAGLLPWAVRNQMQLGAPIVTTTHGGYTFWLANNVDFYRYLREGNWGEIWTAEALVRRWQEETARLPADSELARDRLAYRLARQDISQQPAMFVYSCLVRLGRFWSLAPQRITARSTPAEQALRIAIAVGYAVEHVLMLAGVVVLLRQQHWRAGWVWGVLLLVSLSAAHLVYWTDMRMRAPGVPAEALLAAIGAAGVADRIARRKSQ